MNFKFVKTLEGVKAGENIVIDGFKYFVESLPRPGKSAIVATDGFRLNLIVQTSEIKGITS